MAQPDARAALADQNAELSQLYAELKEIDRLKTEYFANETHEFRTPLTLILAPVEEMLGESRTSADEQRLRTVRRNGLRLLNLVNDLLDQSRLGIDRIFARFQPVRLESFTRELAAVFDSAMTHAGLSLQVDIRDSERVVMMDPVLWERIVYNLLSNALKFTPSGTVRIGLTVATDAAELSVEDSGIGIPVDEQERIFERFHRSSRPEVQGRPGTGIGLAVVKATAERLGGTIRVISPIDSEQRRGSRFVVKVPIAAAEGRYSRSARSAPDDSALRDAGGSASSPSDDRRPRLIIAEDHPEMRAYLHRLLRQDYRVEVFADGRQALDRAFEDPPALVLSDVMMPNLDGYTLARRIKADQRTAHVPVLLLTARAELDEQIHGLECGADDYVVKPFSPPELIARVRAHLRLNQAHAEVASLRERERARQDLQRAKDEFLTIAAHELRTPLTAIKGAAELLRRRSLTTGSGSNPRTGPAMSERDRQSLVLIERKARQMARLITDLLDLARINIGQLEIERQRTQLDIVLVDVVEAVQASYPRRQLEIDQPPGPVLVDWDGTRIRQMLVSLIENGFKYSDPRFPVLLKARLEPEGVRISVVDRGIGISSEDRAHIFERHARGQNFDRIGVSGLGLGLFISRSVVEQHGGRLEIQSEPGQGTTIHVWLPTGLDDSWQAGPGIRRSA